MDDRRGLMAPETSSDDSPAMFTEAYPMTAARDSPSSGSEGESMPVASKDDNSGMEVGTFTKNDRFHQPRPPRARRKKHHTVNSDKETTDAYEMESREDQSKSTSQGADMEQAEPRDSFSTKQQRKSVRWTDDLEGGSLAEIQLALSYNRKELSYAPKTRVKFGIWSPLQKKIVAGCGAGFFILLIVLFTVIFTVVKPKSNSNTPTSAPEILVPSEPISRHPSAVYF